jgi:hypothetical protein
MTDFYDGCVSPTIAAAVESSIMRTDDIASVNTPVTSHMSAASATQNNVNCVFPPVRGAALTPTTGRHSLASEIRTPIIYTPVSARLDLYILVCLFVFTMFSLCCDCCCLFGVNYILMHFDAFCCS